MSRQGDCYSTRAKQLAEFFSRPVLGFWGHEHRMTDHQEAWKAAGGVLQRVDRAHGEGMRVRPIPE